MLASHAIDVLVNNGHVTLRGPVLAAAAPALASTARAVRGVQSVTNELDSHETAERIPRYKAEAAWQRPGLDSAQPNWAPATRAVVAPTALAATGLLAAKFTRA